MNYINNVITVAVALCLSCMLFFSCNEDVTDPLRKDYPENGVTYRKGHVLWIVLDGASGTAVKQANNDRKMPVLRKMLQNALYTFNGLADTRSDTIVSDTLGWDNLLTASEEHTSETPSVFERMKQVNPDGQVALYATTDYFYNAGRKGTDISAKAGSDNDAVTQAVSALSKEGTAPDLTVVELSSVQKAGEQYGFLQKDGSEKGQPTEEVISALSQADNSINKMLEALKKRPAYSQENWLVVITSNYGGDRDNSDKSVFEMKDRNTFSLMYNEKLTSELQLAPAADAGQAYYYYTLCYSGSGQTDYAAVNDPGLFDFKYDSESKDTTSYTIQFMYNAPYKNSNNLTILSKARTSWPGKNEGWEIRHDQDDYRVQAAGSSCWTKQNSQSVIIDGNWHVCTIIFDYKNTHKLLMYVDGQPVQRDYTVNNYIISTDSLAALTIGKIYRSSTSNGRFYLTNLQVYDIALPADYIAQNYKKTALEQWKEFPYWDHLIGYWPCDREEDYRAKTLKDYSKYGSIYNGVNAGRSDMTISGNASWVQGSVTNDNIEPTLGRSFYQTTINVVDIPYQTFQWLGLEVPASWNWSGVARTLPYTDLNSDN